MNIGELKSMLEHFGIRPDKRLGQNFLLSEEVLEKIVAAAELKKTDAVLEIGPGLGVLTKRLAEGAEEVVAIEKDRKLVRVLRRLLRNKKNVKILEGDALFFDPHSHLPLRKGEKVRPPLHLPLTKGEKERGYKLIANIPYYITGKLLQTVLGGSARPVLMVLLLQKEVAQRIVAKPGEMSLLAASVQMYADPEIISFVGKENFYPAPAVDSAVVRLRVLREPRLPVDEHKFFQLVKIGFSNKRKQLQNNLASLPPLHLPLRKGEKERGSIKFLLQSLNLNPLCRAEDLSLEDWGKLYAKLF